MRLVKLGDTWVNPQLVTWVRDASSSRQNTTQVCFSGGAQIIVVMAASDVVKALVEGR